MKSLELRWEEARTLVNEVLQETLSSIQWEQKSIIIGRVRMPKAQHNFKTGEKIIEAKHLKNQENNVFLLHSKAIWIPILKTRPGKDHFSGEHVRWVFRIHCASRTHPILRALWSEGRNLFYLFYRRNWCGDNQLDCMEGCDHFNDLSNRENWNQCRYH